MLYKVLNDNMETPFGNQRRQMLKTSSC